MVLKSRLHAPDWSANDDPTRDAKCRHHPIPHHHQVSPETDAWFQDMPTAALICRGEEGLGDPCPFLGKCLTLSLVNNESHGVFGGLLPIQRKWVRRNISKHEWTHPHRWTHHVPSAAFLDAEEAAREQEQEARRIEAWQQIHGQVSEHLHEQAQAQQPVGTPGKRDNPVRKEDAA